MMAVYEIPLKTGSQRFFTTLNRITYQITLTWQHPYGWFMDIALANGTTLMNSIAVVPGVNLIQQYQHKIKGELWLNMPEQTNPNYDDMGKNTKLYWVDV